MQLININELMGKTIKEIKVFDRNVFKEDQISFFTENEEYMMYHDRECCENVYIEDIIGDMDDLLNSPILMAEEVINESTNESGTWSFYKLATTKGYVTIRWYGMSNGYYSERVSFYKKEIKNK